MSPSRSYIKAASTDINTSLSNLTPEEKKLMGLETDKDGNIVLGKKIDENKKVVLKNKDDKEQNVSKVKYDTDTAELKEKIEKKDKKIQEVNTDREKLRKERDTYKGNLDLTIQDLENERLKSQKLVNEKNELLDKNKKLEATIRDLDSKTPPVITDADSDKKELKTAKKRISELESEKMMLDNSISELQAELNGRDATIKTLRENLSKYDENIARLEDLIESKNVEIESLKTRLELPADSEIQEPYGHLERMEASILFSEKFEDGRYDVKLAKNGSYIIFVRNVEGAAVCIDHRIKLPRLGELIPFVKPASYPIINAGNSVLKAMLI
jgi:chromosome segregation protein